MEQHSGGRMLTDKEWDAKIAEANRQREAANQINLVDEAARRAAESASQGQEQLPGTEAPNPNGGPLAGARAGAEMASQVAPAVGARVGAQMAAVSPERRAFVTGLAAGVVVGGIATMALRRAEGGATE